MAVIERMKSMRENGASLREIGAVTGHGPKSVQRILDGLRFRGVQMLGAVMSPTARGRRDRSRDGEGEAAIANTGAL
jgi:hypothetical protein